ncbi:hypothetical protein, partial [Shigella sonnei]
FYFRKECPLNSGYLTSLLPMRGAVLPMSPPALQRQYYSAAIFLIPICISFDTAEKRRYATYLILNRRFSFEF